MVEFFMYTHGILKSISESSCLRFWIRHRASLSIIRFRGVAPQMASFVSGQHQFTGWHHSSQVSISSQDGITRHRLASDHRRHHSSQVSIRSQDGITHLRLASDHTGLRHSVQVSIRSQDGITCHRLESDHRRHHSSQVSIRSQDGITHLRLASDHTGLRHTVQVSIRSQDGITRLRLASDHTHDGVTRNRLASDHKMASLFSGQHQVSIRSALWFQKSGNLLLCL